MAVSISPLGLATGLRIIRDTDADSTGEDNIVGKDGTVFLVSVDNPGAATVWVKFYDNFDPTVGTTDPDLTLMVANATKKTFFCPSGLKFSTAISFACVNNGGGTAGTTDPASNVDVGIVAQDS